MKSRNAVISPDTRAALADATATHSPAGWEVRLSGVLPRNVYEQVDDTLQRLGGRWNTRLKAHLFPEGDNPLPAIREIAGSGRAPDKNAAAYFSTPPAVAEAIVSLLSWESEREYRPWFLEPSAGCGALVRALASAYPCANIDAVESDPRRFGSLCACESALVRAHLADFLTWRPGSARLYHRIAMNPPFAVPGCPLAYLDHIEHARALLRPDGLLVSVAPASFMTRADRRIAALRRAAREIVALPEGSFRESGTGVNACLVVIEGRTS